MIKKIHQNTFLLLIARIEEYMQVVGYIRVSSDKQDLHKQEHLLLKYAQQHKMQISSFIQIEISSQKTTKDRRIEDIKRLY